MRRIEESGVLDPGWLLQLKALGPGYMEQLTRPGGGMQHMNIGDGQPAAQTHTRAKVKGA